MAEIKLGAVISSLETMFPPSTAESWDQVGLASGDRDQSVGRVLLAVDPLPAVLEEAATVGADLLVTHHPLLLHGIHTVSADTFKGRAIRFLIENNIAAFNAHTNADVALGGVNDALADIVGLGERAPIRPAAGTVKVTLFVDEGDAPAWLQRLGTLASTSPRYSGAGYWQRSSGQFEPGVAADPSQGEVGAAVRVQQDRLEFLAPDKAVPAIRRLIQQHHPYEVPAYDIVEVATEPAETGLGRWGELTTPTTLRGLAQRLIEGLPPSAHGVRMAGDPDAPMTAAAVCGGSGDSLLGAVRALPVDAYVTSDLRHHPVTDHIAEGGCAILDIPHSTGEWLWLAAVAAQLQRSLPGLEVEVSQLNTDPWTLTLH